MSESSRDLINKAAKRCNILASEEALNAAEMQDALVMLNDMMSNFGPRGIPYVHTALALTDTINMPDEVLRDLMLVFCIDLADDYGIGLNPNTQMECQAAIKTLQAYYYLARPGIIDPVLRQRRWSFFSISRGGGI